ncbi:uncharacterized protein [Zea mays]|uniref:Uncharacterized protein n=1 Tax=Zea mays TaxID=4577 RepID=A0A1D6P2X2_MAIZE|nr:uncharacterized protein LOC103638674 [Zea mays]AQL04356.1 hypothetical protein ZEAMMB73_Zm00001d046475 [Zea mays]|eukprot:XP_020400241.1 uncharacterized protein LOC103638674 [Zea mays]
MLQGFHDSGFHAEKPLLVLPSCLLAPFVSAVPMPRSLRLGSHQQHPPALKLSSSQETTAIAAAMNTGRPTARMDVEVNEYQQSGPNNRHDPPILGHFLVQRIYALATCLEVSDFQVLTDISRRTQ